MVGRHQRGGTSHLAFSEEPQTVEEALNGEDAKKWEIAMQEAIKVPLDPKMKLKKNVNKDDEMVKAPYQQAVGSLMYAMLCTRPDLAYPISVVSQHMANPIGNNLKTSKK